MLTLPLLLAAGGEGTGAEPPVDFATQVAPLLERHCLRCHYEGRGEGGISLANADDLLDNEFLLPGDPHSSYFMELVTPNARGKAKMPRDGEPLTADERSLLARWITEGARWPKENVLREPPKAGSDWWSFQPLGDSEPPPRDEVPVAWRNNAIDRFIYRQLKNAGLEPNGPADRPTLLRRVTYDLTGLPPTPEETAAFLADESPEAYERVVDRLLDSPRYGERWGRHWLDVIRFGESRGFERNEIINTLWPLRDFVIESLNADKPFDQLIREHLAGDVFGPGRPEVELGSAFLVCGPYDDVGNQDPVQAAQIRADTIDEIIRATSEAFLGLTLGCARCHDHKFDPILQRDYYALYATFAGVRHGERELAAPEERAARETRLKPLEQRRDSLAAELAQLEREILERGLARLGEYETTWVRPPIDRRGVEELIEPVKARFVRLISEGQDANLANTRNFNIDEFEIWTVDPEPRNVALAAAGGKASGGSRQIADFPGAYGPHLAIDGRTGERFIATEGELVIELASPETIRRIVFSSARGEAEPGQGKFAFVGEYRIEVSLDGAEWVEVANSHDRAPLNTAHRDHRLRRLETKPEDGARRTDLQQQLAAVQREIAAVPPPRRVWIGNHVAADARGPFHIFLGGSPQRRGAEVFPGSLAVLRDRGPHYELKGEGASGGVDQSTRRKALAEWITDPRNPLTPRVLANRVWQHHFGTGIVDTPSDFGYMGGRPTHPELLDWLARRLLEHGWRLKPLHREILLSQAYRQASSYRAEAARQDADSRLLWRFPPRRLSAEEVRDSMLATTGVLRHDGGGPGFRLYRYLQDNVATYVPLDQHGPETYRRAVYHQNARAARIDLMTEFDQPDCAFSIARRVSTTTPLQALTMLNHDFTVSMARHLAERLRREAGEEPAAQVDRAFVLCLGRGPSAEELEACLELVEQHGTASLGRVLLNTSEFIFVR